MFKFYPGLSISTTNHVILTNKMNVLLSLLFYTIELRKLNAAILW